MYVTLMVLVVVGLLVVAGLTGRARGGGALADWPLQPWVVMSAPEQVLYWRLLQALPQHMVLAQVQLSRFLRVTRKERSQAIRNKIDRKSADFLICSKDATPVCVIELDDSSHESPARRKADADKDAALKAAGIRVVRFHVKALPDVRAITVAAIGEAFSVDAEARG